MSKKKRKHKRKNKQIEMVVYCRFSREADIIGQDIIKTE